MFHPYGRKSQPPVKVTEFFRDRFWMEKFRLAHASKKRTIDDEYRLHDFSPPRPRSQTDSLVRVTALRRDKIWIQKLCLSRARKIVE